MDYADAKNRYLELACDVIKLSIFLVLLLLFSSCGSSEEYNCATPAPVPTCGENPSPPEPAVFKAKCATCHRLDKHTTGPKLQGVLARVPSESWFDAFVRNEDSLAKGKDPYTLKIQEWSEVKGNHQFKDISNE